MTNEHVAQTKPETFRLPTRGTDPHFGFSRSFYYQAEKRGLFRLIRIRERGKQRGITLVNFDAVASFVRSQDVARGTGAVA